MPTICIALALIPTSPGRAIATTDISMAPTSPAFAEAEIRLETGDRDGVVERFEAGLELLPLPSLGLVVDDISVAPLTARDRELRGVTSW